MLRVSLPVGDSGVTVYETGAGGYFSLHAGKEYNDLAVNTFLKHYMLPSARFGDEDVKITESQFGVGVTYFALKTLNVLLELYGEQESIDKEDKQTTHTIFYIAPGVEMDLDKSKAIGLSIFKGFSDSGYNFGFGAKLQFSF